MRQRLVVTPRKDGEAATMLNVMRPKLCVGQITTAAGAELTPWVLVCFYPIGLLLSDPAFISVLEDL